MIDNEEEIIAHAFVLVKKGIIAGDWQTICDAYEAISGEKLSPPSVPQKSKLERIREKLAAAAEETISSGQDGQQDNSHLTVKELTNKLKESGYSAKDLKGKKKSDLLALLDDAKSDLLNDDDILTKVIKQKGGKLFAKEGFDIISTEEDPIEAAKNKARLKNKIKRAIQSHRVTVPNDDPEASYRYQDSPKHQPPWK